MLEKIFRKAPAGEMDFLTANYHTHTTRCKHAWDSEREYVEAAIEMGIRKLGFSDHVPCTFPDGHVSGIRMDTEQAPEYVECIRSLEREYRDDIEIFVGFEAEYIREFFPGQRQQWKDWGIDYCIQGQHFLGPENHSPYAGSPTGDENILRTYVDLCIEGMQTGSFTYLAHPDLINYRGPEEIYRRHMQRLCLEAKRLGIPLEVNLLGLSEGKHYPSHRFFALAAECGNPLILGLDAHWADGLRNREAYAKASKVLKELGAEVLTDVTLRKPWEE